MRKYTLENKLAAVAFGGLILYSLMNLFSLFYMNEEPGFMTPILLLCAFIMFIRLTIRTSWIRYRIGFAVLLGFLIFVLPLGSVLLQRTLHMDVFDDFGRSSLTSITNAYGIGALWMMSGIAVQPYDLKRSTAVSIFFMAVIVSLIALNLHGGYVISYGNLVSDADNSRRVSHLVVGDTTVFLLLVAYACASDRVRTPVVLVGICVLYALGGRSDFFLFMTTIVAYGVLNGKLGRAALYMCIAAGMVLVAYSLTSGHANESGVKDMLFSSGIEDDSSFAQRIFFFVQALKDLGNQALIGDPRLIVKNFYSMGAYMHNLLSAWQFYGAPTFIVLLLALIYCGGYFKSRVTTLTSPMDVFSGVMLIYVVFSSLLSKSVSFYLLWFIIGYWLAKIATQINTRSERRLADAGNHTT